MTHHRRSVARGPQQDLHPCCEKCSVSKRTGHHAFLPPPASTAGVPTTEERLYKLLRGRGWTFLSVGHRSSLLAFHDFGLEMQPPHGWRLVEAADYQRARR